MAGVKHELLLFVTQSMKSTFHQKYKLFIGMIM